MIGLIKNYNWSVCNDIPLEDAIYRMLQTSFLDDIPGIIPGLPQDYPRTVIGDAILSFLTNICLLNYKQFLKFFFFKNLPNSILCTMELNLLE